MKSKGFDAERHISNQIYPSHSNGEKSLWIGLWTFAVFYSIYCVSPASEGKSLHDHLSKSILNCIKFLISAYYSFLDSTLVSNGWFNGRLKDNSDHEWTLLSGFHIKLLPWMLAHFAVGQSIRKFRKEVSAIKIHWNPFFY